jgi:hypothetical protein
VRPLRGRAVTLKWQQATKNLTLEGADKGAVAEVVELEGGVISGLSNEP